MPDAPSPLLLVFVVAAGCFGLWLPVALPQLIRLGWRPGRPIAFADRLKLLLSLYLIIPIVVWAVSAWLAVPLAAYGLGDAGGRAGLQVLAGLGLGTLGLALLFGFETAAGWAQIKPVRLGGQPFLLPLVIGLFVGGVEELLFRGFLFQTLLPYGPWTAAVASSLVFAALHLIWQLDKFAEAARELPGLWAMGMVLVLARILSGGNLYLAWGLHAGWVWGMTLIDTHGIVRSTGAVREWVSGLGGKPLAGAMGLVLLAATAIGLWLLSVF